MGFESEEIHEMGSDGNGLYLLHVAPESQREKIEEELKHFLVKEKIF